MLEISHTPNSTLNLPHSDNKCKTDMTVQNCASPLKHSCLLCELPSKPNEHENP